MTMKQAGTPWAEVYRGSGRLTGRVAAEPTRTDTGEVAPGWAWVGDMEEDAFWDQAESEQIGH